MNHPPASATWSTGYWVGGAPPTDSVTQTVKSVASVSVVRTAPPEPIWRAISLYFIGGDDRSGAPGMKPAIEMPAPNGRWCTIVCPDAGSIWQAA